jgi:aryl-alcohol dehydrogenase-like predicted oxidoreductase
MENSIPKRAFGKTGMEVTAVSLGSLFVTDWLGTRREDGIEVVHRALERGVNYIDTAPFYGNAQQLLGEALEGRPESCCIGTKCGRWDYRTGPFRSLDALKRQFETTLRDLRRDRVDILYIHEADWYVWWEDVAGPRATPLIDPEKRYDYDSAPVIEFLHWAKEHRLTRFIGLSGNSADLVAKVLREIRIDIDAVLIAYQYSLLWRNAVEYLFPVAKEKEAALVVGTPFQQGRLAVPHPEWLVEPPAWMDEDTRKRFGELYQIQQETGLSLAELGLRFLLSDPDIACVIPGAANAAQLEENVRCATAAPLPDGIYHRLLALGKVFPDRYY